jgi:hypothetical protein
MSESSPADRIGARQVSDYQKFCLTTDPNQRYNARSRPGTRGVSRSSQTRDGMRWTRQRRRATRWQGELRLVSDQKGVRTNDVAAYGEAAWSWHPLLVSSWRRFCGLDRVRQDLNPPMTVTRRIRRRGERDISRKAIAQGMSDASAEPVCSCAHFFAHFAHETAGAARARHSLRPLFGG